MEDLRNYLNSIRHDFAKETLDEHDVIENPLFQFAKWFEEAVAAQVIDPNAMTLCSATKEGKPSARIVLLRNFSEIGFVYYSNYNSRKGAEIEKNPNCALLFFWPELERQIRIEGVVQKQSSEESDLYFNSRPRESKLGAWTSEQSKKIINREVLNKEFEKISLQYPDENVPRPPHWGGYLLKPITIEFWQGRPNRLHDRILYTIENNTWKIERLAP
jgi:pyridoxamine 5'-phosphate oxidase